MRSVFCKYLLCSFLVFFLTGVDLFSETQIKGQVSTYHAMQLKSPNEYMSSRTIAKIEACFNQGDALALVSFKGVKNSVVESESGVSLKEAYIEYVKDWWDLRIGRQLIIWGKADGLQVTDLISPKDYSEFLARDFEDMRLPVEAVKARILGDVLGFEFIWIPVFSPNVLPSADNPWFAAHHSGLNIKARSIDKPGYKIADSEVAGKLSVNLSGIDFALSCFYTWDDNPVMHNRNVGAADLEADVRYHRMFFSGAEFSMPVSDFVLRGEGAFFQGKYFDSENASEDPFKKNMIKALAGIDWSPGNNWSLSFQFENTFIAGYDQRINDDENSMTATVNISKKLLRDTLEVSTMLFYGITDRDIFDRTKIDYALTDELHLLTGVDVFAGSRNGGFGRYRDNTEVWVKANYSI